MRLVPKKTAQTIIDSDNDYLGALKGNQSGLLSAVKSNFQAEETVKQVNKGHGRIEKRTVSISHSLDGIPNFPGLKTLIRGIRTGGIRLPEVDYSLEIIGSREGTGRQLRLARQA
jgi:hypothetical protein